MNLLGLELHDAGIMMVQELRGRLLEVDGRSKESPGFAFLDKKNLYVGREAEKTAYLRPDQITNRFWDQLSTEEVNIPGGEGKNHAEIACAHLKRVWKSVQDPGNEVIIAVPDFFDRNQLGIILGIAQELSIRIRGLAPLSLVAPSTAYPNRLLLHLDFYLHRIVVTILEQGEQLAQKESFSAAGIGLDYLYNEWIKTIAEEFVRVTRFDPLHSAASEQELYNQLPTLIIGLQKNGSEVVEMVSGHDTHRVSVSRELFVKKCNGVFQEIRQLISSAVNQQAYPAQPVTVLATHRASRLPGLRDMLSIIPDTEVVDLAPGAAARGALILADQFPKPEAVDGVSFLTSRPWQNIPVARSYSPPSSPGSVLPTHVLHHNMAYPISEKPLVIGSKKGSEDKDIVVSDQIVDVAAHHCSIQLRGGKVVLDDFSIHGTFVDKVQVSGSSELRLGQVVRTGTAGENLQLIACINPDET